MNCIKIKLTFIEGLRRIVYDEVSNYPKLQLIKEDKDAFYFNTVTNTYDFEILENLKSVLRVYVIQEDDKFNPFYICKHKSVLGNLINFVLKNSKDKFRTFKVSCAGSDSKEVKEIIEYIGQTFKLDEHDDADLKVHIIKTEKSWEIGVEITRRPLTMRSYKVENIKGGINPTIAYAINSLCNLQSATSYLNIFSGSATLLIEAAHFNSKLRLIGFDNNKKSVSLAIQNIKKAGLIKSIQLKAVDIFAKPDLGKFDVITSDLPFGMLVSKDQNLEKLYQCFIDYCENVLSPKGTLVVYTSEYETLERLLMHSKFKIVKTIDLKFLTSVNAYLYPKIFMCMFK